MKETIIKEKAKVKLKEPILIEGLPGLGMVGRISAQFLIKQLGAKKFAEIYSPHFPYYVLVDKKGSVRLLRGEFYYWKGKENDLILLTGDSQAQTIEGQYAIATSILDFAQKHGVKMIITMGGFRQEVEEGKNPRVIVASTDPSLLKEALKAGAVPSSTENPIVGTAGLLLGLAKFRHIRALCLLGETRGYLPDPKAAKSVLNVLCRWLGINVNINALDKEIRKSEKIMEKMREIEKRREMYARELRKVEEERVAYIS